MLNYRRGNAADATWFCQELYVGDGRDEHDAPRDSSLEALSRRLGSLQQSLTVVAAEIGVNGSPTFRHLDAQHVYTEAARVAREQIKGLDVRVQAAITALAQRQEHAERRHEHVGEQTAQRLARLEKALIAIDTRLEALWTQIETSARTGTRARAAKADTAIEFNNGLAERLAAQEQAIAQLRDQLAALTAAIERNKAPSDNVPAIASAPAIDLDVLRDEILAKMRQWMTDRLGSDALPIAGGTDIPNPLVIGAAERAIVRLTHRIERMEEWRDALIGDSEKRGRGLKGRLFES